MHFRYVAGTETDAGQPLALFGKDLANPVRGGALAVRRHQFQRHVVERKQHAVRAVTGVSPCRRTRQQRLTGHRSDRDIADQHDDMIEPGDHRTRPRKVSMAGTCSAARSNARPEQTVITSSRGSQRDAMSRS
jgi:hypothetical protein